MNDFFKSILDEHGIEPLVTEAEEIRPAPKVKLEEDWKPQTGIQTPHRPHSDPETFQFGEWDCYYGEWSRLALPWPRYPEPGAVATPEIEAAYSRGWHLASEASDLLARYLFFVKMKHLRPGFFQHGTDNHEQMASERLAWLKGVWNSRALRCPEPHEFLAMSLEQPPQGKETWHTDEHPASSGKEPSAN